MLAVLRSYKYIILCVALSALMLADVFDIGSSGIPVNCFPVHQRVVSRALGHSNGGWHNNKAHNSLECSSAKH